MKPANFSPVYACLYPELAEIARKHGYALAIHGSMARDFDLVAVPWTGIPSEPIEVIKEITSTFAIRVLDEKPTMKNHGRMVHTLVLSHGSCFIDLSFMPKITTPIIE